ncbi:MAG: type II toxin-antitoxin system VapC family toxin [Thermoanaerobaculia bacterium]
MRFVLDCSVTMAWCFEDEADRYSDGVLASLSDAAAVVPGLWPLEVANVLMVSERRGRVTREDGQRFLEHLASLPITVDPVAPAAGEILAVARAHRLSAYDAAYLHLAVRTDLPLATRDRTLRAAARAARVGSYAPTT